MSRYPIARKAFRDARVTALGGGLLSFSLALMYVLMFPWVQEAFEGIELPSIYERFAGGAGLITEPAGFLATEYFSFVPLVIIIFAVVAGTGATAGEESAGTLDLLLAQPVSRRRVVVEKAAGLTAAVSVAMVAGAPGAWLGQLFVDFDLAPWRILLSMVLTIPLLLLFLMLAMFAGATLPNRAAAVVLTTAMAVAGYVLQTLGLLVTQLEDARKVTPFYWAEVSEMLVGDINPFRPLLLLVPAAVILVFTVVAFERRDIASGSREIGWQRWLRWRKAAQGA
jgi:ABC-2 type transport system permease protein